MLKHYISIVQCSMRVILGGEYPKSVEIHQKFSKMLHQKAALLKCYTNENAALLKFKKVIVVGTCSKVVYLQFVMKISFSQLKHMTSAYQFFCLAKSNLVYHQILVQILIN